MAYVGDGLGGDISPALADGSADAAAHEAMLRKRAVQLLIRGLAGGAVDVAYERFMDGRTLNVENARQPFSHGAVSAVTADLLTDWLITNSSMAKSIKHRLPEVLLSEPIIAGVVHFLYARFMRQDAALIPSFVTQFALGAVGAEASQWAVQMWS